MHMSAVSLFLHRIRASAAIWPKGLTDAELNYTTTIRAPCIVTGMYFLLLVEYKSGEFCAAI